MHSVDRPSIEGATASLSQAVSEVALPVSAGWFVRRAALWMLIVGLGIAGSCLLYMAASKAEADSLSRDHAANATIKG